MLFARGHERFHRFDRIQVHQSPAELADRNTRRARLKEAKRQLEAELEAGRAELEQWRQAKADYVERTGRKAKDVYQPIRVAITGTTVSPGIFDSLAALGREESVRRIEAALGRLEASPEGG